MDTPSFKRVFFDPPIKDEFSSKGNVANRDGAVYVYTDQIILAVNAALAAKRPLLVTGEPGTGKSTLAQNVAQVLKWRFIPFVVTSRTEARDLLWTFDALKRLRDAQIARADEPLKEPETYVRHSAIWEAFHPEKAQPGDSPHAVVLIDEIDKADPDVPNDLLGVLGEGRFVVSDTGQRIVWNLEERNVLFFLTSNGERELSPAFLRRCVHLPLAFPGEDQLVEIATRHFGTNEALHRPLAKRLLKDREEAQRAVRRPPSTAEYLDTIAACRELKIGPGDPVFDQLLPLILSKLIGESRPQEPGSEPW